MDWLVMEWFFSFMLCFSCLEPALGLGDVNKKYTKLNWVWFETGVLGFSWRRFSGSVATECVGWF